MIGAAETLALVAHMMEDGRRQRAARALRALRTLKPYERELIREAAVMGYVLGRQIGEIRGRQGASALDSRKDYPSDAAVLQNVIEHCDSTGDLYPYLADAAAGRRRRVTRKRAMRLAEGMPS